MKKLIMLTLFCTLYLIALNSSAGIYFNQKIAGPITNISQITDNHQILAMTPGKRQQDREFSIAPNGDIAFSSNRRDIKKPKDSEAGAKRVPTLNIFIQSGKAIQQISRENARSFAPKYNHNGTEVAYLSTIEKDITNLIVYNVLKQTSVELVTEGNILDFDWSFDSKHIAYSVVQKKTSSIKLVNIKSKTTETLISAELNPIAKTSNSEKGTPTSPYTKNTSAYLIGVKWSPNNKHIAYIEHPLDRAKKKTLYIYNLKSKNIKKISNDTQQVQTPVNWNSKSNTLLYSALVNYKFYYDEEKMDKVYEGALHLYTTTLDGKTTQLTSGNHFHGKPVFSPNESHIAYLYAEKLGDQRTYTLKTIKSSGEEVKTYDIKVSRDSELEWVAQERKFTY